MAVSANVIALPEMKNSTGLVTWWKLAGEIDLERLAVAWGAEGLSEDDLPSPLSPSVALRRALKELFEKPRAVTVLNVPHGYAVVDISYQQVEGEELADPVYTPRFKAWVKDGVVEVSKPGAAHRKSIWLEYNKNLSRLDAVDLSSWLVARADAVQALRLRDGGGVYFVPATRVELWRRIARALESVSRCIVWEISAMRSDKAMAAILDALRAEAEQEVERMTRELTQGDLGARAIQSRKDQCAALVHKVREYEALLNARMESVHEMVSTMEARLVEAALVADC